jgi:hypothetical protein
MSTVRNLRMMKAKQRQLQPYRVNYWRAQRDTIWPIIEGDCDG